MGSLSALADVVQQFEWRVGVTPLSRPEVVGATVAAYLLTVFGIRASLAGRAPVAVPAFVPALHNLILCVGSLAMFLGCAWASIQTTRALGSAWWMVCLPVGTPIKGPLWFWSYVYYLSKYYELLDTVLLALRKKPLTFLHVSHHAMVLPMSYLWVAAAQSEQQVGLLFNTGIHVAMYYYYFLCTLKIYPAWKRFITTGQIVQFMFSFVMAVPYVATVATSPLPAAVTCSGHSALVFNAIFNAMLLVLFINFHVQTYKSRKGGKAA